MTPHLTSLALWKLITLIHVSVFQPCEVLHHHPMPRFVKSVHFVILWDTFWHSKWMICKSDLSLYLLIPSEELYNLEGSISIYKGCIEPFQCILFWCSLILFFIVNNRSAVSSLISLWTSWRVSSVTEKSLFCQLTL